MLNKSAFICSKINGNIMTYYYEILHLNILVNVHYFCDDTSQCHIILQKSSKYAHSVRKKHFLLVCFY